jgi:hypothetical protein
MNSFLPSGNGAELFAATTAMMTSNHRSSASWGAPVQEMNQLSVAPFKQPIAGERSRKNVTSSPLLAPASIAAGPPTRVIISPQISIASVAFTTTSCADDADESFGFGGGFGGDVDTGGEATDSEASIGRFLSFISALQAQQPPLSMFLPPASTDDPSGSAVGARGNSAQGLLDQIDRLSQSHLFQPSQAHLDATHD